MPLWFLKHEVLHVDLPPQNDTLFVSWHLDWNGLHVRALTSARSRPIVLDSRRAGESPLISADTTSLL